VRKPHFELRADGLIDRININVTECSLRHFATLKYLNHSGIQISSGVIMDFREAFITVLRKASSHSCFTNRQYDMIMK